MARGAVKLVGGDPQKVAKVVEQIAPQVAAASDEDACLRLQRDVAWQRRARLRAVAAKRRPLLIPGMETGCIDEALIEALARNAAENLLSDEANLRTRPSS